METLNRYNKLFKPIAVYSNWADNVVLKRGDRYLETNLSIDAVMAKLHTSIVIGSDYLTQSLAKVGIHWKLSLTKTEGIL